MEAADRWEHAPPPHSFEELRDTTRIALRSAISSSSEASGAGDRSRFAMRRLSDVPEDLQSTQAKVGPDSDVRELLQLLAGLGADDRERLLDLARRLAAEE